MEKSGRKIVYVVGLPLVERDAERYGVRYFQGLGFGVTILDVSGLVTPRTWKTASDMADAAGCEIVKYARGSRPDDLQRRLDEADLVICIVGSGYYAPENWRVLRAISKSKTPFLIMSSNFSIPFTEEGPGLPGIAKTLAKLVQRLRRMSVVRSAFVRIPYRLMGLRPADYAVYGGKGTAVAKPLFGGKTRAIWAHSKDYDAYLSLKDGAKERTGFAVFVDQGHGHHTDKAVNFIRHDDVDPGPFHAHLTRFLDAFEAATALPVVIARHPRISRDLDQVRFGDREVVAGKTAELIRDADAVIGINSTALNLAVLFDKPIIIVSTADMHRILVYRDLIDRLAASIGVTPLMIDRPAPTRWPDLLKADRHRYRDHIRHMIKTPESPDIPYWALVHRELSKDGVLAPTNGSVG